MFRIIISLTLLLLFCDLAYAGDSDRSLQYLRMIFGTVEGIFMGTGTEILGPMFKVFNSVILSVGGVILFYIMVVGTINTAHEGEMLGKKWSAVWIPLRAALGITLLVPKTSGYCLAQILVMWIVVQGINTANSVWGAAIDYFDRGGPLISASGSGSAASKHMSTSELQGKIGGLADKYLGIAICTEVLNESFPEQYTDALSTGSTLKYFNSFSYPEFGTSTATPDVAADVPTSVTGTSISNYSAFVGLCGKIKIGAVDSTQVESGGETEATLLKGQMNDMLFGDLASIARSIVSGCTITGTTVTCSTDTTSLEGDVGSSVVAYQLGLNMAATSLAKSSGTQMSGDAKKNGWLLAGTYYFDIVKRTNSTISTISSMATEGTDQVFLTAGTTLAGFTSTALSSFSSMTNQDIATCKSGSPCYSMMEKALDIGKTYIGTEKTNFDASSYNIDTGSPSQAGILSPSQASSSGKDGFYAMVVIMVAALAVALGLGVGGWGGLAVAIVSAAFGVKILVGFSQLLFDTTVSPIIGLALVGWGMMDLAIMAWGSAAMAIYLGGLATSMVSCMQPIPFGTLMMIIWGAPFFTMIMTTFLTGGAFLAIYIPMIPFIIFTTAALGWFFAVIEAMVAAPLIGLGIMHPEGDTVFGRSEGSLTILLNVFLRPSLMIFGFILASIFSFVGIWIFNELFFGAVWGSVFSAASIGPGAVIALPFIMIIYGSMVLMVIEKVFPLIHMLPDKITRWIGGGVESAGGDMASGAADSLKSAVSSTAGELGSLGKGGLSGVGKLARAEVKAQEKYGKDPNQWKENLPFGSYSPVEIAANSKRRPDDSKDEKKDEAAAKKDEAAAKKDEKEQTPKVGDIVPIEQQKILEKAKSGEITQAEAIIKLQGLNVTAANAQSMLAAKPEAKLAAAKAPQDLKKMQRQEAAVDRMRDQLASGKVEANTAVNILHSYGLSKPEARQRLGIIDPTKKGGS